MRHATVFSGKGAPELAAKWLNWQNIFHCEINPFCQVILKYYFPESIAHEDIKKTDFTIYRGRIDVLTGGFPCQPYSAAGLRKGKEDERHLWPEFLRAIQESKPRWVVGENVRGIISWNDGLVFQEVQTDLEAEGYEVQPFILPAAGVGAPHERYRVWFIAFNSSIEYDGGYDQRESNGTGLHMDRDKLDETGRNESSNDIESPGSNAGHTEHNGSHATEVRGNDIQSSLEAWANEIGKLTGANRIQSSDATNSKDSGRRGRKDRQPTIRERELLSGELGRGEMGSEAQGRSGKYDWGRTQDQSEWRGLASIFQSPGEYASDSFEQGYQGGIRGQFGSDGETKGQSPWPESSRTYTADYWREFPIESPVRMRDDGIPDRLDPKTVFKGVKRTGKTTAESRWRQESIKASGNSMVPQVVYQIYKAIELYEASI